jgi:hypothetical protein
VTKTSTGQPIEFEPVSSKQNNNLQTIYFNYDTIVDFSIGIQEEENASKQVTTQFIPSLLSKDNDNENLKAEIEGIEFFFGNKLFLLK